MSRALWVYGGGGSADLDIVTATAPEILQNKVIVDAEGEPLVGTMPNRGSVSQTLTAGQTYTIPAGYHTGNGKIVATDLASQTAATATAASILKGKTAWVAGKRITGTIPTKSGGTFNPNKGSSKTIYTAGTYVTNDVVLNPFALPPANKLAKGYTYSLYGVSVTGTAEVVSTPSLILNYDKATGYLRSVTHGSVSFTKPYLNNYLMFHATDSGFRLDQKVNLGGYNTIKVLIDQLPGWAGHWNYNHSDDDEWVPGVTSKLSIGLSSNRTDLTTSGFDKIYSIQSDASTGSHNNYTWIIDVSNLLGSYYFYMFYHVNTNYNAGEIDKIWLE